MIMTKHAVLCEKARPVTGMLNKKISLQQADRLGSSLRRSFVDEFFNRHVASVKPGSKVLDLGGHRPPRRGQFDIDRYDLSVCSANLSAARKPDVQTDAAMLPFHRECFDVVVCAELLEHVPDPASVLREVYRILRRQGTLLISVPFLFHIHADPHDYGRYTDQYWKENLDRIGFRDVMIEKQGLFWSVMVDMIRGFVCERIHTGRLRSTWMHRLLAVLIDKGKRWALATEALAAPSDNQYLGRYTTGYGIRVVKP